MSNEPRILPGTTVLAPMEPATSMPRTKGTVPPTRSKDTRNRFGVLNAFVDCSLVGLSRAEALAWLVLYRDTRNGTARTSAADIARRIGASRRAVVTALAGLRRRGLLTLIYRGGLNRGTSVYRVHPLLAERPP